MIKPAHKLEINQAMGEQTFVLLVNLPSHNEFFEERTA